MPDLKGPAVIVQNRAKQGLFAGKHIRTGNTVSHSNRRARRTFQPNIQSKHLHSQLLNTTMKIEVTTRALRTIDKYGGLDNYILNTKPRHFRQQTFALELRDRLMAGKAKLAEVSDSSSEAAATQVSTNQ